MPDVMPDDAFRSPAKEKAEGFFCEDARAASRFFMSASFQLCPREGEGGAVAMLRTGQAERRCSRSGEAVNYCS